MLGSERQQDYSLPMSKKPTDLERQRLTAMQYAVTRENATEPAFTGEYVYNKDDGSYCCVCCDTVLFDAGTKYDSGSGWPSFTAPSANERVVLISDNSHGMHRTEVRCTNCDAHLGHVFDDGPDPGGKRFCVNSAALNFKATDDNGDES